MIQYMLFDGYRKYLRRDAAGNFVPVTNIDLGDHYNSRTKAQNVLQSCVNKNLRSRYRVKEIVVPDNNAPASNEKDAKDRTEKKHTEDVLQDMLVKPKTDEVKQIANEAIAESEISKWSGIADNISNLIFGSESRKEGLIEDLSEVDQEISDIYHYIEFSNLNAYQGFLAYRMLHAP